MTEPTDTGMNRTGVATSPIDSRRTIDLTLDLALGGAAAANTAGALDGAALITERSAWARSAPPLGTMPPPGTLKGMIKTVIERLEGHKPAVFLDKLGERLAFERTGTRLYEAVIAKLGATDPHPGGPSRSDLDEIHDAERRHFGVVRDAIVQLGADPTAMTPSADLVAMASLGWVQAIADPRTTLTQSLDILLIAELADSDGWQLLVDLADQLGFDELAGQFRDALREEERHVLRVRGWITTALLGEAGADAGRAGADAPRPRH